MVAQNHANLYLRQFRNGNKYAAVHAHALYREALEIRGRLGLRIEYATTAMNLANLYSFQFDSRNPELAASAHELYDKARMVFVMSGRKADFAVVNQAQANLYLSEFRSGSDGLTISKDYILSGKRLSDARKMIEAKVLYQEARDAWIELGIQYEVARVDFDAANLYSAMYHAGDAKAAEKAHELFDSAISLGKNLKRDYFLASVLSNKAILFANQFRAGEAGAAAKAQALYDEALAIRRSLGQWLDWLRTARLRFNLLEREGRLEEMRSFAREILVNARGRLSDLRDRADRDRLLTVIAGVGARGAAAALRMAAGGDGLPTDDVLEAVRLLEGGRAQQLGARLREQLAELSGNERAALDQRQLAYESAGAAVNRVRETRDDAHARVEETQDAEMRTVWSDRRLAAGAELAAAEKVQAAAHADLNALKAQLGLDDITIPVPEPAALAEALGAAALVQAVPGRDGGWLLVLVPGAPDWQAVPVEGLTTGAVKKVVDRYLAHVGQFQNGQLPDGTQCPPRSLDPVNAFSKALATTLLPGDGDVPGIWDLIAGPIHRALQSVGFRPAAGAAMAPEVVLCLPAELAMLPMSAACDPGTGRPFFQDYALRLVPSLGALMASATRARRPVPRTVLAVSDPIDDLPPRAHPAAKLFPTERTELTGYMEDPGRNNVATWQGLATAVEQLEPGYIAYFGHSHWDARDGEGSGLVLAPDLDDAGSIPGRMVVNAVGEEKFRPDPDLATPSRVRSLALSSTRLVFSASCGGAGLGLVVARDEMGGLPAAWLEAGAAGMISSLYTVYTGPAEDMMRMTFAALLEDGLSPVQALRRAQMELASAFEEEAARPKIILPLDASGGGMSRDKYIRYASLHPTAHVAAFVLFGE